MLSLRTHTLAVLLFVGLPCAGRAFTQPAPSAQPAPTLAIQDLGKGAVPLDGTWQFHLGDDPSFATPAVDDTTGHNGWEQLTAGAPWGAQGHRSYVGYAWYRRHLDITPASGVAPNWSLYIPRIGDIYALYWNGNLVATHGKFPPNPVWRWNEGPQTIPLGALQHGVLAIRVYQYPLGSYEDGIEGGFYATPILGTPHSIATQNSAANYTYLLSHQFDFGVDSLESLVVLLTFLAWFRDRSQKVLLFTALLCSSQLTTALVFGLRNPWSYRFSQAIDEPVQALADVALWLLLLHLLDLHHNQRLVRWTKALIAIDVFTQVADGFTCILDWSRPALTTPSQIADGSLTAIYTVTEFWPIVLVLSAVLLALRPRSSDRPAHHLNRSIWIVAAAAFIAQSCAVVPVALEQGSRFTHWTLGRTLVTPLFQIAGNSFSLQNLSSFLLLLAIIYAVVSYSRDVLHRKQTIEMELQNARAVQQVLIPEELPTVPGFRIESVYKPADEVGGDFFQIIPAHDGGVLVVIGDVSGKGMPAAMTVSLLVGTMRTLAHYTQSPGEILAAMNQRMLARSQGGFTTCLALHADAGGKLTLANAGHLAPWRNGHEIPLESSLPLGLTADSHYAETTISLAAGDNLTFVSDGVVEATSTEGELFGFERTRALTNLSAQQIAASAQAYGQKDDITVLTLTFAPLAVATA
jgi:Stage II sporulation protein E (SpoIIE)